MGDQDLVSIFRSFKRHYHKIREVAAGLPNGPSIRLSSQFTPETVSTDLQVDDEDTVIRLVVLMRRFLDHRDHLYYRRVLEIIKSQTIKSVDPTALQPVEELLSTFTSGSISVIINGESITAERVYQLISDGEYFGSSQDIQDYLKGLYSVPFIGQFFWAQFYWYTMQGCGIASMLFDLIRDIEQSPEYQPLAAAVAAYGTWCIYCLTRVGSFTSEEHVFPESLGNDTLVLPRGYVCDGCNNNILSPLDEALLEFPAVAFLRTYFTPFTKQGKLPEAHFANASMIKARPNHLKLISKNKPRFKMQKTEDGQTRINFTMVGRKKFDPKLLGRAVYKVCLGMVALGWGQERTCNSRYDQARAFICGYTKDFPNNLLLRTKVKIHSQVRVSTLEVADGTPFAVDIFGVGFMVNLEASPTMELDEQLTALGFEAFPLYGQYAPKTAV